MEENIYEKLAFEASCPAHVLYVRFQQTVKWTANSDPYLILSCESVTKKKKTNILRNQETGNRNKALHFMWQPYLETHYIAVKRRFSPEPQTKWQLNHSGLCFSCLLGFSSLIYLLFTQDWKHHVSHANLSWTVFVWNDVTIWNATLRLIVATFNQDTAPTVSGYLLMCNCKNVLFCHSFYETNHTSHNDMLLPLYTHIVILIIMA